jgi:hypothetical protein
MMEAGQAVGQQAGHPVSSVTRHNLGVWETQKRKPRRKIMAPDGTWHRVTYVKLHRAWRRYRSAYKRHTDWLAQTARHVAWGRTKRDAYERLLVALARDTGSCRGGGTGTDCGASSVSEIAASGTGASIIPPVFAGVSG